MFGIYLPVDEGYFIHFQGLLYSFKDLLDVDYKIHIIDIGLSARNLNILHKNFGFLDYEINKIPWTRDDKLSYKFKIDTIELMTKSNYDYTMMLDAKNHLKKKLSEIISYLNETPILIQDIYPYYERDWTHNIALECMGVIDNYEILNSYQYQSNNPVFDVNKSKEIMLDIVKYGNMKEALCPMGSKKSFDGESRHRQDQSVISCILKKHNIKPSKNLYSNYHNTIHL
tara:strand:- start:1444 stop:2127 length:684 start_codon:yes stop_codon:yes gene_type:complete